MLIASIYALSLSAGFAIVFLCLLAFFSPRFQFWPPPSRDSWQYRTFWILFRLFILGLIIFAFIDFGSAVQQPSPWRYFIGIPLAVFGFGAALYLTNFLGWRNAYGEAKGLETAGMYRWSRNPIYVVTIVGMVGIGTVVASWIVTSMLIMWTLFYLLAPFLEEPWLEREYGAEYLAYKKRVPRFLGFF